MAITSNAAEVTVQAPTSAGALLTESTTDATNGHKFRNDGRKILRVRNGSGSSVLVTVETNMTYQSKALPDDTLTVTNNTEGVFGPFASEIYNTTDGYVRFGVNSGGASVTHYVVSW